ncbi:MAG: hypothetical protein A3J49_13940 [Gallionellales bacterium RIFCSPHIGHO2_02_FULL_57_16]|nr:MAG: hypothetical protein A3J49_13940 [Gallionellales bacterium RIFCSPHIGHO2_02_FULL_57_16]
MLATIKLNSQILLDAIIIEDISPHRMLPPEFCASDAAIAQKHPQQGFRIRHAAAHFSGPGSDIFGKFSGVMWYVIFHAEHLDHYSPLPQAEEGLGVRGCVYLK